MRISPIHAMPVPPPMHQPSMAVITGFSSVSIRSTTSRPITRSMRASCSEKSAWSFRLAPAENARLPAPRITMARVCSRCSSACSPSSNACSISTENTFKGGALIVIVLTAPSCVMSIVPAIQRLLFDMGKESGSACTEPHSPPGGLLIAGLHVHGLAASCKSSNSAPAHQEIQSCAGTAGIAGRQGLRADPARPAACLDKTLATPYKYIYNSFNNKLCRGEYGEPARSPRIRRTATAMRLRGARLHPAWVRTS